MSGGTLDFNPPKPDWLNFGRSVEIDYELTITAELSLSGLLSFYNVLRLQTVTSGRWHIAYPIRADITAPHQSANSEGTGISMIASAGQPMSTVRSFPWWAQNQQQKQWIALRFQTARRIDESPSCRFATAQPSIAPTAGMIWANGERLAQEAAIPYQQAMPPPHGWRIIPYVRPPSAKHEGRLNFACFFPNYLNFGLRCLGLAQIHPAIRRSYRVLNTAALIRVSDSMDIPCSSIRIGLDWASWCWSLSATLIGRAAHDLVPSYPGLVRATLNGFVWDFIVDDLRYSRRFGEFIATLAGRSPAAVMSEPYATTRSYTEANLATAYQLVLQELVSGWQLDWAETLTDWTVPANTYQYQSLTPIASINRIAKSSGGRVYADTTSQVLHVLPKWPVTPWNWGTAVPDQSLPSSYTLTEQRSSQTGAEYDCIVVSGGVNNGVCVLATRDGMPGTYPANAVVDSLITDLAPATARAKQEIADQWPMKHYQLSLPLQATPEGAGLLLPGTIFDFVDGEDGWRGLVIGVTLTAGRNEIMQDLEIVAP